MQCRGGLAEQALIMIAFKMDSGKTYIAMYITRSQHLLKPP